MNHFLRSALDILSGFPRNNVQNIQNNFPYYVFIKTKWSCFAHWLGRAVPKGAPWVCREQILKDMLKVNEVRSLLASTIDLQIKFIIDQFKQQLPGIMEAAPSRYKSKIMYNTNLMLSFPQGSYALVDYLNLKGNGLSQTEELKGQRMGTITSADKYAR